MTIRLVLVDDHAPFRACLAGLLAQQPGVEVAAQVENGDAAVRAVQGCVLAAGDTLVVVMDVALRGGSGIDATRRLLAACPQVRVLALSMHDDPLFVSAMADAGARGYVLKGDPLPDLVQAIRRVADGHRHFAPGLGQSGSDA